MKPWNPWTRLRTTGADTPATVDEPERALERSLAALTEAMPRGEPARDPDALWQRVEAALDLSASPAPGHATSRRRWIGLRPWASVVGLAAAGLLVWGGFHLVAPHPTQPPLTRVRLNLALWETDDIADAPLGGATEELVTLLKPRPRR